MGIHTIAVSYIPNPDPEALIWLEAFADAVKRKAQALGVDPPMIETFGGLVRDFHHKLDVASSPDTRTSPAITAKIVARNAAVLAVKPIVKVIRANPGITPVDLLELGLPAPKGGAGERRKVLPAPATAPILSVAVGGAVNGSHRLRFADERTPDSHRKPDGVLHLQLYVAVDKELVSNPARASFHGLVTRSPFDVQHDPADNGKTATYFGRWSTRTGLTGPWSIPVGMTVVFVQRGT